VYFAKVTLWNKSDLSTRYSYGQKTLAERVQARGTNLKPIETPAAAQVVAQRDVAVGPTVAKLAEGSRLGAPDDGVELPDFNNFQRSKNCVVVGVSITLEPAMYL